MAGLNKISVSFDLLNHSGIYNNRIGGLVFTEQCNKAVPDVYSDLNASDKGVCASRIYNTAPGSYWSVD